MNSGETQGRGGEAAGLQQAAEDLLIRLDYLRELGLKVLGSPASRRGGARVAAEAPQRAAMNDSAPTRQTPSVHAPAPALAPARQASLFERKTDSTAAPALPPPPPDPEQARAALEKLSEELGPCRRCRLHEKRQHIVFGEGHPAARLVFAGEGPGHDEDVTGRPFVGRAGQLLDRMIAAMGLKREDCYICNVVKCRPPDNRTPQEDEMRTCGQFLARQLEIIRPHIIVALGTTAAKYLLNLNQPMGKMRGRFFPYADFAQLIPTFHPAYLLRNPAAKREVWQDLQQVMARLAHPGGVR